MQQQAGVCLRDKESALLDSHCQTRPHMMIIAAMR